MPRRLIALVALICVVGGALVCAAAITFALTARSAPTIFGVAALLAASGFADRFPVPIRGMDNGGVSLSFVFGVAAIVLFGWSAGLVVLVAAPALTQTLAGRPAVQIAYNVSVLAIAGTVAAALVGVPPGDELALAADVAAVVGAQYALNVALITAAVAISKRCSYIELLIANLRSTLGPFALMGSAALMLVVLWERSPLLSVALLGPLLAIQLYQRASAQAEEATRLAVTDPLTGLGNLRHFDDRLARELERAGRKGNSVALCLVDVDDFKRVNDGFGHPAGDRVLAHLGTRLRHGGEAFRLGGDEFALLLPGYEATAAAAAAAAVVDRIAATEVEPVKAVTVSAGVAAYPEHADAPAELVRVADAALYQAKERGKNRVRVHRPGPRVVAPIPGALDEEGFRAAATLAQAVDTRDAYTGRHSTRVAELAAQLALRLGLDMADVELTRLAAGLHDVGKLAVPDQILLKPGPLTSDERLEVERHPHVGSRLADALGIEPVADCILHHHERFDGNGYPGVLGGTEIPLGARIILVADAYDAMTSDRVYRTRLSRDEARAELERCAGTQFDPEIVSAFLAADREGGTLGFAAAG